MSSRPLRRFAISLLLIALIYFNVAALLLVCDVRLPRSSTFRSLYARGPLPNHWALERLFRMYDLFDRWSMSNVAYSAFGSPRHLESAPATPLDGMVDLDVYRYFPQSLGEAHRRLYLLSYRSSPARIPYEYRRMSEILHRLHNESRPDAQVAQVFLYRHTWPKSPEGYWHRIGEGRTTLVGHN